MLFAWLGAEGSTRRRCRRSTAFLAPASHSFAFKGLWHCNWLQAFEVGIDPAHPSFLHRYLHDGSMADDEAYGRQFRAAERRRRRRRALADDAHHARVPPPRDPLRRRRRRPAAPDDAAADDRSPDPRARDPCRVSGDLRDPALGDDHDHADARAGRRHAHLLVLVLHQLRRAARQGCDARAAAGLRDACPTTRRSTAATIAGASIRRTSARAPTSAWARTTSTCTTSGRSRAWERSRTARASTSARATR